MAESAVDGGNVSGGLVDRPAGSRAVPLILGGEAVSSGNRLLGVAGVGAMLALWVVSAQLGIVDPEVLPGPRATAEDFWQLATDGFQRVTLWEHLAMSLMRMALGLGLGGVAGVVAGLAIGSSRTIRSIVQPAFGFFRLVPVLGLLPLIFVRFGPGSMRLVSLLAVTTFFIVAIAVRDHVAGRGPMPGSSADRVDLRTVRQALPATFLALRVAAAVNWNVLVAGELISFQKGLGAMIWTARTFFQYGFVLVAIFALVGVSALVDFALRRLGDWLAG